ncbi:SEC-C domain-containing protein [Maridesulfovibrio frigidus]|uniref:SEC-C domain-containing protein n=1 Tax=Maridesulfovibrio frigidus TaxID=340956 RepID=UPI0004E25645|nr:SEC-C domain-containing protein [Maridesulfovibrio frigidus]
MSKLIKVQFDELVAVHKRLSLKQDAGELFQVVGDIGFSSTVGGVSIKDRYQIEIHIPLEYPDHLPVVREVGGRISKDFHINPDGTLCLAAEIEVKRRFVKRPTLKHFIEDLVIPFLFQHSFFAKYGKMPFGELSHGAKGTTEFYCDFFEVEDEVTALVLLKVIAENNYRGHHQCPCGSGRLLRKCHGAKLLELMTLKPHSYFFFEYVECVFREGKNLVVPNILKSNLVSKLAEKQVKNGYEFPLELLMMLKETGT